jgi:spore coat protein CotH
VNPFSKHRPNQRLMGPLSIALAVVISALPWSLRPAQAQAGTGVFDSSTIHHITVDYDQAAYDGMIATFKDTGDKGWIGATVTIDGSTYQDVEMRLKGNSSLSGLGGRGFRGRGFPRPQASGTPDAAASPAAAGESVQATDSSDPAATSQPQAPSGPRFDVAGPDGGPGFGGASADEPERLPWLIRLDRKVEGQNHLGTTDIVVRSSNNQTSLNEAVALELLERAGLASQQAAPTSFSVNGGQPVLRLIIENPDDAWMAARFDGEGALYKAESTGDWSYRGDDPKAYDEVFDQEAGKDVTDLSPLIEFLRFINQADDTTFATELPKRLDVDGLATYLAMMDLLDNFDDIDGPGNNAYLRWDATTGRFAIVPWDMNLAFGALGGRGGDGPGGFRPPDGFQPNGSFDPAQAPDGFRPGGSFDPGQMPDGQGPGAGVGRFGRGNPLIEKFHANADFEALYQAKTETLRAELLDSGVGQDILDRWVAVLTAQAAGLVDAKTITEEADRITQGFAPG